jgi:hypothetical protein
MFACADRVTIIISAHHVGCNARRLPADRLGRPQRGSSSFCKEARGIGNRDGKEALSHDAGIVDDDSEAVRSEAFGDGGASST